MSNYIYPEDRMQVHCIPGYPVKQTWKLVTDERVLKIYQRAVAHCVELGWLESADKAPKLYTSTRLTRALAFCWQKIIQKAYYAKDGIQTCSCAIIVTADLLKYPDKIVANALCHELGHATCKFKEHHSGMWFYRANKIAQVFPDVKISVKATSEEMKIIKSITPDRVKKNAYKYQLVCPKCGATFTKYKTMCATLQRRRFQCGNCHVPLSYKVLETGEIKEI